MSPAQVKTYMAATVAFVLACAAVLPGEDGDGLLWWMVAWESALAIYWGRRS